MTVQGGDGRTHHSQDNVDHANDKREQLFGVLMFILSCIMFALPVITSLPDPFAQACIAFGTGFALKGIHSIVRHAIRPGTSSMRKMFDIGILFLFIVSITLLLFSASASNQIAFSDKRIDPGGMDAAIAHQGKILILSWSNASVNTYCRIQGNYRADNVTRMLVNISDLKIQTTQPSMKVQVEGAYLSPTDPADVIKRFVDADWALLRAGPIQFSVPEELLKDNYISDIMFTFNGVLNGTLQLTVCLGPSHLQRLLIQNRKWIIIAIGAIAVFVLLVLLTHRKNEIRTRPANTRPGT